jgi:hypothetical protein
MLIFSLALLACIGGFMLVVPIRALRLPGNNIGYEPAQPIQFSHRQHAGDMQISCLYCHSAADKSRHAGIPSEQICMNCHREVKANLNVQGTAPEIQKLYDAIDQRRPVAWTQVYRVPSFVRFDHSRHVQADVDCASCHGTVETMDRVKQTSTLSMGECVKCHRQQNSSIDCAACHQ